MTPRYMKKPTRRQQALSDLEFDIQMHVQECERRLERITKGLPSRMDYTYALEHALRAASKAGTFVQLEFGASEARGIVAQSRYGDLIERYNRVAHQVKREIEGLLPDRQTVRW